MSPGDDQEMFCSLRRAVPERNELVILMLAVNTSETNLVLYRIPVVGRDAAEDAAWLVPVLKKRALGIR
jgi:hypothetical protein